jgi:hypothetical protein
LRWGLLIPEVSGCRIQPNASQAGSSQQHKTPARNQMILHSNAPKSFGRFGPDPAFPEYTDISGIYNLTRNLGGVKMTPAGALIAAPVTQRQNGPDWLRSR